MRRFTVVAAVLALVAAACGDDHADTTTAIATATTTSAGTTTTTAATSTTAGAATTTTEGATAARVAAAQELEGEYEGDWNNTTFNTTGSIEASFVVDAEAGFALLTVDLGGSVFGSPDPAPFIIEFDLTQEGPFEGTNALFGDYVVEVGADGHVTITAAELPNLGLEMIVEGGPSAGGFEGTYTIEGLAVGTWAVQLSA